MTETPDSLRRHFADRLRSTCDLRNRRLVDAFAAVPRERFVPPGPWIVRSEVDRDGRQTPDADPRHLYDNVSVAIDAGRQLFNAAPGAVAPWIDALDLGAGRHVFQVGCGLGYYTAILAECVGPTGRVAAVDVDETLAARARENLAPYPQVDVRVGDGRGTEGERFDAILVHAGVTHPEPAWLDALGPGGRLVLPLTCTFPQMGPLGKGYAVLLTAAGSAATWHARVLGLVMIYSAVGLRDPAVNAALGRALLEAPAPRLTRFRRDPHDAGPGCWFHQAGFCFSED